MNRPHLEEKLFLLENLLEVTLVPASKESAWQNFKDEEMEEFIKRLPMFAHEILKSKYEMKEDDKTH